MWCPKCEGEYREGIVHCPPCDVALVESIQESEFLESTGPLTGRPLEEELEITGPALAGSFVTQEEAQAGLRALADEGIQGEIANRDEPFPMNILEAEPALGLTVPPEDLGKARKVLRSRGLLPIALARFRTEGDARNAFSILESKNLNPRISTLVLDEIPEEFREDMDPFILEVPAENEQKAAEALVGSPLGRCDDCGAQTLFGESHCKACGRSFA
jgi:hypothetical protein